MQFKFLLNQGCNKILCVYAFIDIKYLVIWPSFISDKNSRYLELLQDFQLVD